MKKTLLSLLALATLGTVANAQITIVRSDLGNVGDSIYYGVDSTASSITINTAGANMTWDFSSNISPNYYSNVFFLDPSTQNNAPAEATHYVEDESGNTGSIFMEVNDNQMNVFFSLEQLGQNGYAKFKTLVFPLTYGTKSEDSAEIVRQGKPEEIGFPSSPLYDSVKITVKVKYVADADSWGTLKTPAGDHATIRVKNTIDINPKIEGKKNGLPWFEVPFPIDAPREVNYMWLAKSSKYFLAQATMDETDDTKISEMRYQVGSSTTGIGSRSLAEIPVSVYPNPASQMARISFELKENTSVKMNLFDATGKLVISNTHNGTSGSNSFELNTDDLKNGLYFLQVQGKGFSTTKRFAISK